MDTSCPPEPPAGRRWPGPHGWPDRWPHGWPDRWPHRWPDRGPRHPAGLAVLIAVVQVVGTTLTARGEAATLDPLGYALLAAGGLALAARRRWPVATAAATVATTVVYGGLGYPTGPTFVALIIAGVGAVKAGHRYPVWGIAAGGYAGWVALAGPTLRQAAVLAAWVVGGLLVAEWSRAGAQHRVRLAQVRAERARATEEQQRRQASEERLRIAQELHDVLGHHLSLINVQAGVGLHLMDSRPEQVRVALGTIKQASAEALREVRSVLATLYPAEQAPPRTPAAGLDRLAALTVDAGLPVHASVVGTSRPLPPELDRAAYRIVQEALTNVRRHAGAGATAAVVVDYRQDELVVEVTDDGSAALAGGAVAEGNGIGGMRERAAALGGSLDAGPRPEGGFRVLARLPLPAGSEPAP
ncbi:MAG: sensor histidine kinase [Micromonosporaceae bacterium]|nr:sensor histidine kinase [Micromonosporaceae bacterium]